VDEETARLFEIQIDGTPRVQWMESSAWCPSSDGGDDFVGVCIPCEGLRFGVGLGEEAVDGGLGVDDGAEEAAFQAAPSLGA